MAESLATYTAQFEAWSQRQASAHRERIRERNDAAGPTLDGLSKLRPMHWSGFVGTLFLAGSLDILNIIFTIVDHFFGIPLFITIPLDILFVILMSLFLRALMHRPAGAQALVGGAAILIVLMLLFNVIPFIGQLLTIFGVIGGIIVLAMGAWNPNATALPKNKEHATEAIRRIESSAARARSQVARLLRASRQLTRNSPRLRALLAKGVRNRAFRTTVRSIKYVGRVARIIPYVQCIPWNVISVFSLRKQLREEHEEGQELLRQYQEASMEEVEALQGELDARRAAFGAQVQEQLANEQVPPQRPAAPITAATSSPARSPVGDHATDTPPAVRPRTTTDVSPPGTMIPSQHQPLPATGRPRIPVRDIAPAAAAA